MKGIEKIFFEITLEMFSILEYIGQIEILAEKNYLGCFRRLENSNNQRKIGFLSFRQEFQFLGNRILTRNDV